MDGGNYKRNVRYNRPEATLPKGYLDGGYYKTIQGELILKKEYIVEYPKNIARDLSDKRESRGGKVNKRSQVRKFYEYTLRIHELLKQKSGDFCCVEAELNRLIPFVKYAYSRDKVSDLFVKFIEINVTTIRNSDDLRAFVKHFEALIAYMPKDKN